MKNLYKISTGIENNLSKLLIVNFWLDKKKKDGLWKTRALDEGQERKEQEAMDRERGTVVERSTRKQGHRQRQHC